MCETIQKHVCGWCDEESEIAFNWTETLTTGLATDIVCSKCISMMFEEDPESIKKVIISRC